MNHLEDFVVVFDLDDTLYPERDYVISGIKFLEDLIYKLYDYNFEGNLLKAYNKGIDDFLGLASRKLNIEGDLKNSLLWSYRLHNPKIKLKPEIKNTLEKLINLSTKIVILTDGRSITQRLKINSLGLGFLPYYISEEYSSEKPEKKRFLQIQDDFPSKYYVYIADNPSKDFIAPLEMNWICIGANWIKNRIHNLNLENMPKICLDSPSEIPDLLLKLK